MANITLKVKENDDVSLHVKEERTKPTQSKSTIPTYESQTVLPDEGFLLSSVGVEGIPDWASKYGGIKSFRKVVTIDEDYSATGLIFFRSILSLVGSGNLVFTSMALVSSIKTPTLNEIREAAVGVITSSDYSGAACYRQYWNGAEWEKSETQVLSDRLAVQAGSVYEIFGYELTADQN